MNTLGDELVTALLAIDGVAAAAVEPQDDGPGTLRLELVPGSDEVAVASAVNRLLRARFGLAVDAERVQVLEHAGPPPAASASAAAPEPRRVIDVRRPLRPTVPAQAAGGAVARLVIQRVEAVAAGAGITVTVTLTRGATPYVGRADGAASAAGTHRAVAAATLRAVEAVVGGVARFEVDQVELARLGAEQAAVVLVTMVGAGGAQRLTGASVVRGEARAAVIRAVLAAVNRRVEALVEQGSGPGEPALRVPPATEET